jgi:cytochrome c-type biogenesis protein CcmF
MTGLLLPFTAGQWSPMVAFGLALAAWIIASGVTNLLERVKHASSGGHAWARLAATPRAYYGMLLAHLGVAVFVIGVTMVKGYEIEKDVRMTVGDTVELRGYVFRLEGVADAPGPNYSAARAKIAITRDGNPVTTLYPEKRVYHVQNSPMTEAAIAPGLTRDLYVALGDALDSSTWLVRVYVKPFIDWIWGGCLVMAMGGLLAATDRRYRMASRRQSAPSMAEASAQATR